MKPEHKALQEPAVLTDLFLCSMHGNVREFVTFDNFP